MSEIAKRLYLMQLQQEGIPEDIFHFLGEPEKKHLVERNGRFFLREEERKKITVVLTGGVYDILHIGHLFTLTEAKKHGDVLVVALAKDDHIRKKGREPVHPIEYRKMMVEALKPVDAALSGFDDPKKMIGFVGPDVIVYGYDQKEFLKPQGVRIVRIEKKIDDSRFKTGRIIEELGL
ncbi:MAG: adenylyltransferase/cytidyltransferase family protein [Candidatus Micrarchaeia archaeon]